MGSGLDIFLIRVWISVTTAHFGLHEFTWDILSLQEKEFSFNANKQQLDSASRRLIYEGKELFMEVFPGKFKNWISQSGPGGGNKVKKRIDGADEM